MIEVLFLLYLCINDRNHLLDGITHLEGPRRHRIEPRHRTLPSRRNHDAELEVVIGAETLGWRIITEGAPQQYQQCTGGQQVTARIVGSHRVRVTDVHAEVRERILLERLQLQFPETITMRV